MNDTHAFHWHNEPYATTIPHLHFFFDKEYHQPPSFERPKLVHVTNIIILATVKLIMLQLPSTISSTFHCTKNPLSYLTTLHTASRYTCSHCHRRLLPQLTRLKPREETKLNELRVHFVGIQIL